MVPNPNSWIYDRFMESTAFPPNAVALIHVVQRPVALGPGQSFHDLSCVERLERAVDWEATARSSIMLINVGTEESS